MHYAFTYDGKVSRMYRDGVEQGTQAFAAPLAADTSDLTIGGNVDDASGVAIHNFHGAIDEVVLYNRVLPPSEIMRLAAGDRPR